MQDQIVGALLVAARLVLVVAALGVALLPIARSLTAGFCADGGSAAPVADVVAAAGAVPALAAVEPSGGEATEDPVAPSATEEAPNTGPSQPATPSPTDAAVVDDGPCAVGVDRCLPPLVSAVVTFGAGACGDQAQSLLRDSMVPAFGISSVLLAGAWVLRPRHGDPVLSRS